MKVIFQDNSSLRIGTSMCVYVCVVEREGERALCVFVLVLVCAREKVYVYRCMRESVYVCFVSVRVCKRERDVCMCKRECICDVFVFECEREGVYV